MVKTTLLSLTLFILSMAIAFADTGCNVGTTVYVTQSGTDTYGTTTVPNYSSTGQSYPLGPGLAGCHAEETGYASTYGVCVIDHNNSVSSRYININIIGCSLDAHLYLLFASVVILAFTFIRKNIEGKPIKPSPLALVNH